MNLATTGTRGVRGGSKSPGLQSGGTPGEACAKDGDGAHQRLVGRVRFPPSPQTTWVARGAGISVPRVADRESVDERGPHLQPGRRAGPGPCLARARDPHAAPQGRGRPRGGRGETFGPYQRPLSVELVRYVHSRWVYERTGRVPYSRAALMRRDKFRCGYCGAPATTMDHVVPRCQGGTTTWLNAVAACEPCNSAKAGRTPRRRA